MALNLFHQIGYSFIWIVGYILSEFVCEVCYQLKEMMCMAKKIGPDGTVEVIFLVVTRIKI